MKRIALTIALTIVAVAVGIIVGRALPPADAPGPLPPTKVVERPTPVDDPVKAPTRPYRTAPGSTTRYDRNGNVILTPAERGDSTAARVPLATLVGDYNSNEVRANSRYTSKRLRLSGVVGRVWEDEDSSTTDLFVILVEDVGDYRGVQCQFPASLRYRVSALSAGEQVEVEGVCAGQTMGDVVLVDCTFP